MGKLRIVATGRDKQVGLPGTETTEKAWQKQIMTVDNHLDARTAVKACAANYDKDTKLQIWEKSDGQEVNHFEISGTANRDLHPATEKKEKPVKEAKLPKPAKAKVVKLPKAENKTKEG